MERLAEIFNKTINQNISKITFLSILCLSVVGCAGALESNSLLTPSAAKSDFFTTTGAGFVGTARDRRMTDLHYVLSLQVNKESEGDVYLNVCFENPEDVSSPICSDEKLSKNEKEVNLESPIVKGLIDKRNYEVVVKVYNDRNTIPLGTHRQFVRYYDVRY